MPHIKSEFSLQTKAYVVRSTDGEYVPNSDPSARSTSRSSKYSRTQEQQTWGLAMTAEYPAFPFPRLAVKSINTKKQTNTGLESPQLGMVLHGAFRSKEQVSREWAIRTVFGRTAEEGSSRLAGEDTHGHYF